MGIYKTVIMCHMDYGDFVIDSGTKVNTAKIAHLQIRTISCIEYHLDVDNQMDMLTLYHRYNLEPLEIRRK